MPEPAPEPQPAPTDAVTTAPVDQPRDDQGRYTTREGEPTATPAEAAETTEPAPEAAPAEIPQPPGSLPRDVRDEWQNIPEAARGAFKAYADDMARKLGEAQNINRAINPIFEKVREASQVLPSLEHMTPEQIAEETFGLAKWADRLNRDPAGAVMSLIQDRGLAPAIAQRLQGQPAPQQGEQGANDPATVASLMHKIEGLNRRIEQMSDPRAVATVVDQRLREDAAEAEVQRFRATKDDWDKVESDLSRFIPIALERHPGASYAELLEAAYDMAVYADPDLRAERIAREQSSAADRQRAESADRAAALNVKAVGAGEPAPMTLRQQQSAVFRKHYGAR